MTLSLKSPGGENSSMIMILLHASRRLLWAVWSPGSQHFSRQSSRWIAATDVSDQGCTELCDLGLDLKDPILCMFPQTVSLFYPDLSAPLLVYLFKNINSYFFLCCFLASCKTRFYSVCHVFVRKANQTNVVRKLGCTCTQIVWYTLV